MYSAGLLALLITFALNQMQTKYLLVETEDNSEADPMPKEEVKAVLAALKFPEGIYNSLSKSSQQKIQKKLLKLYGNDKEEVIYIYIYRRYRNNFFRSNHAFIFSTSLFHVSILQQQSSGEYSKLVDGIYIYIYHRFGCVCTCVTSQMIKAAEDVSLVEALTTGWEKLVL